MKNNIYRLVNRYSKNIIMLFVAAILLLGVNVGIGLKLLYSNDLVLADTLFLPEDYVQIKHTFKYDKEELYCKNGKTNIKTIEADATSNKEDKSKVALVCLEKKEFKPKDAFKAAIVPVVSEIELLKKLKCNYVHTERKWYIKKSDLELCSKDNAINEIEHILENVALYHKNKEYIRNSWK